MKKKKKKKEGKKIMNKDRLLTLLYMENMQSILNFENVS